MGARIFNIQKYSIYDGPGIRTLVFFKGCPLNCLWCSNPEGKSHACETLWNVSLCSHCGLCASVCPTGRQSLRAGVHIQTDEKCGACGKCAALCPARALKDCGRDLEIGEILAVVMEDEIFYKTSGGGVTLGGGEPLAQPEAARALLEASKSAGLNTALETCGLARRDAITAVAPFTDLFLYDLKHTDNERHKQLTGAPNTQILSNLCWLLDNGFNLSVRMPLINGCNADLEEMRARAAFLGKWRTRKNFRGVHLLPYHRLGVHKYGQLGEEYGLGEDARVSDGFLDQAVDIFAAAGIPARVIRH
ncbi:MAG: choline TMA-lyase-activating enzyme [Desulfovibrio sp.]|nr:choline TMA-lyase-activating enzyme [Desulfovibrio sp.]